MCVTTRLSIRSRTAMHSPAILSIMACTRSVPIAPLTCFIVHASIAVSSGEIAGAGRPSGALGEAGVGEDARREVPGGEGLDGHLREVSVPGTAATRSAGRWLIHQSAPRTAASSQA